MFNIFSNRNDKYIERVADKNNYDKNLEGKNSQNRLHSGAILIYEESKPKLNSRIVRELPSRKDIVAVQCADSESHARNRRIFGSLLGTLQKFNLEESRLRQKEEKKALIERKVEKQALLENEFIKKEREELFINRKKKQAEIKQLEQKMNRLHDFEMWQNSFQQINRSIATKTLPQIYFRPKIYSKKTQRLLNETQERLNKELKNKRLLLESDFSALENFNNKESINNNQHHRDRNGNNDKDISRSYSNSKISSSVRLNSALSSTATSIRFRGNFIFYYIFIFIYYYLLLFILF